MVNHSKPRPVFIGGTGRSGTTILAKILSNHSSVHSFDQELRFMTDPDGIISLKNALVDNWSLFHGDKSMERFLALMKNLKTRYIGRYPNHGLAEHTSHSFYNQWVQTYISNLVDHESRQGWAGKVNLIQKGLMKVIPTEKQSFFIDKSYYCPPLTLDNFIQLTHSFINELYVEVSKKNNKSVIIDHTPSNLIHLDFLTQLLPDLKFVHIYRDPRDIIASYKTKDWGSNHVLQNSKWIQDVYDRWNWIKKDIPSKFYLEISFETLIGDSSNTLKSICHFLDIPFEETLLSQDLSRHNIGRWKSSFTEQELTDLKTHFDSIISEFGYHE